MNETVINKKITYSIVAVLLIVLVTIGATYAYFSAQATTDVQTVTTGTLTMGFTNGEIINATGIVPISDSEIKTKATELPFSITNTGNQHTKITIELTDITIDDALKDIDFRWGLYNADTDKGVSFGIFKYSQTGGKEILLRDVILDKNSATKNYKLRIWIHDDGALQNEMQGKTFSGKVVVTGEAIEYTDESCFGFDSSTGAITSYSEYEYIIDEEETEIEYRIYNDACTRNVVIPRTINGVTVTKLEDTAFYTAEDAINIGYPGISSVIIPDTVTSIGESTFESNNLTTLTIPENVTEIKTSAFAYNNINTLIFPESVKTVGSYAFVDNSLKTLVIPGDIFVDVEYGAQEVFERNNLTDVVLMEGFNTGSDSFDNYKIFADNELTSIEIPSSVRYMSYPFLGNPNLNEIIARGKSSFTDFGYDNENGFSEAVCVTGSEDDESICLKQANVIFRP